MISFIPFRHQVKLFLFWKLLRRTPTWTYPWPGLSLAYKNSILSTTCKFSSERSSPKNNFFWSPPNELLVPRWEGHSLPQPSFCWGRSRTLDIYTFPSVFFQPICQGAGSHSLSFQGLRLQPSLRTNSWINLEQGHLSNLGDPCVKFFPRRHSFV